MNVDKTAQCPSQAKSGLTQQSARRHSSNPNNNWYKFMLPLPGSRIFYRPTSDDTGRTDIEYWAATVTGIDLETNRLTLVAHNPGGGLIGRSGVSEGHEPGQFSRELLTALASPPAPGFGVGPYTIAHGNISTQNKIWVGHGIKNVGSGNDPGEVEFDLVNDEIRESENLGFQGTATKGDGSAPLFVTWGGNVVTLRMRLQIWDHRGRKTDGILSFRLDRIDTPFDFQNYT